MLAKSALATLLIRFVGRGLYFSWCKAIPIRIQIFRGYYIGKEDEQEIDQRQEIIW